LQALQTFINAVVSFAVLIEAGAISQVQNNINQIKVSELLTDVKTIRKQDIKMANTKKKTSRPATS
jgi:hypothetical protein